MPASSVTMAVKRPLLFCLLLLSVSVAAAVDSDRSAHQWLEQMNQAISHLNYEGRFVYQHGHALEAMHMIHSVKEGEEQERLVSLNGAVREVVRNRERVVCSRSGKTRIGITRGKPRSRLGSLLPIDTNALADYYRFSVGGIDRVAGRHGQVILIEPRDELRYGYRLVLDKESGLPLDNATIDGKGEMISRMMYTEIHIGSVPDLAMPSSPEPPPPIAEGDIEESSDNALLWPSDAGPAGYKLTNRRHKRLRSGARVEHLIFSDGLASISMYIEAIGEQRDDQLQGSTNMGGVNAMGRLIGERQVTVVGEVPMETLSRLLDAVPQRRE